MSRRLSYSVRFIHYGFGLGVCSWDTIGMMEKKMETTTMGLYYKDYIRVILELYWDNGKWKLLQWGYIGILLGLYWG